MANLTPTPGWDGIPRLETVTPALGGSGAPMNTQAQALLNRTEQLKSTLDGVVASITDVDNTADVDKPISTATQTALATKAPLDSPTFSGTVQGITKTMVGLGNVDNTSDLSKPLSSATNVALSLKAPIDSPTFTGTVSGITKTMVGLGNVDNTPDASKPVSTAQQNVLNQKANKSGDTFTGAVTATQFNGSGAGLTGTASSLNVGNSAAVNGVSGWSYSNWGNNPAYLWVTEGSGSLQHLTTPGSLSVGYANVAGTASGQDNVSTWGFVGGDSNKPYFRYTPNGAVKQVVTNLNSDSTVYGLRQVGNPGYLEISGSNGAFGVNITPSDIRLKSNIVPSSVDASSVIKQMEFIEFDMQRHIKLGFSAQNLQSLDANMVQEVEQPVNSPLHHLGSVKTLEVGSIIAYLGKALQEALARIDSLEDALKATVQAGQ